MDRPTYIHEDLLNHTTFVYWPAQTPPPSMSPTTLYPLLADRSTVFIPYLRFSRFFSACTAVRLVGRVPWDRLVGRNKLFFSVFGFKVRNGSLISNRGAN